MNAARQAAADVAEEMARIEQLARATGRGTRLDVLDATRAIVEGSGMLLDAVDRAQRTGDCTPLRTALALTAATATLALEAIAEPSGRVFETCGAMQPAPALRLVADMRRPHEPGELVERVPVEPERCALVLGHVGDHVTAGMRAFS